MGSSLNVGFPVDLRYGWNLRNPYHQQLLQRANNRYKPFTTTIELRNHPWRKISKDDSETLHAQQLELPMLQFLAQHCSHLAKHQQKVIIEGPARSTIWSDTPLGRLRDHSTSNYSPQTCADSPTNPTVHDTCGKHDFSATSTSRRSNNTAPAEKDTHN